MSSFEQKSDDEVIAGTLIDTHVTGEQTDENMTALDRLVSLGRPQEPQNEGNPSSADVIPFPDLATEDASDTERREAA